MAKPIIKIKRGLNSVPVGLSTAELAVDLQNTKLYVGNSSGVSIPIAARVSDDSTMGGVSSSDNLIPTQKAVKTYIDGLTPASSNVKSGITIRLNSQQISNVPAVFQTLYDSFPLISIGDENNEPFNSTYVTKIGETGLKVYDPTAPFYTGLYQNTKDEMIFDVNYSVFFSTPYSFDLASNPFVEMSSPGFWRSFGIEVYNRNLTGNGPFESYKHYGTQTRPPSTGSASNSMVATLMSSNAIIKLPKSTQENHTEMRFVFKIRSADSNSNSIGYFDTNNGGGGSIGNINQPPVAIDYGIRIDIVKLHESVN